MSLQRRKKTLPQRRKMYAFKDFVFPAHKGLIKAAS